MARPPRRRWRRRGRGFVQQGGRPSRRPDGGRVPPARRHLHRTRRGHRRALAPRAAARSCTATRTSATSSSTSRDGDRTGFLDWAVICRAPGHARRRVRPVQLDTSGRSRGATNARWSSTTASCSRAAGVTLDTDRGMGAVPAVRGLLVGRGGCHRRDGIEVAVARGRLGWHATRHRRMRAPRLRRSAGVAARVTRPGQRSIT